MLQPLLERLESGTHAACTACVWRPSPDRSIAFGISYLKHGLNWHGHTRAISVQISQDPAGTTPERTGCLCSVCNSANSSDQSAQQGIALWKAGVDRDEDDDSGEKFLSRHYWTNAVLHGDSTRAALERGRRAPGVNPATVATVSEWQTAWPSAGRGGEASVSRAGHVRVWSEH